MYAVMLSVLPVRSQSARNAQTIADDTRGKTFGVIIGVSNYKRITPLKYADKDATLFYNFLMSTQKDGKANERIFLLLNEEVTQNVVANRLYRIRDQAVPGDKVFIYFSGHGDMEHPNRKGSGLLLLSNAPAKNYLQECNEFLRMDVFSQEFVDEWSANRIKTIFIFDACHSGSLAGGAEGRLNTASSIKEMFNEQVHLLSCQPNELSLEGDWGGGRGLFSYYLIPGLQGLADKNKDSLVTLLELESFLKDSVSEKSELTQIPTVGGEKRSVMSKVTRSNILKAKQAMILRNNLPTDPSIAFKGNEEDFILGTIKDSSLVKKFRQFRSRLEDKEYISPKGNCALSEFESMPGDSSAARLKGLMKLLLINHLQEGFSELLRYFYDDAYNKFDFGKKFKIQQRVNPCLNLIGKEHYLYGKLKAQQLFLSACDLTTGVNNGMPLTGQMREKMQDGIVILKQAIALDSLAPYLYLRIGDYYLNTFAYGEAIAAYEIYHQLLPNDEYAYNKLGLAYMNAKQYPKAIECFTRALKINNQLYQAQENFKIARSLSQ